MNALLEAAASWERYADSEEAMAKFWRERGQDLSAPGQSAGDVQARLARQCAHIIRLEHETGKPHCMCHERPRNECSNFLNHRHGRVRP